MALLTFPWACCQILPIGGWPCLVLGAAGFLMEMMMHGEYSLKEVLHWIGGALVAAVISAFAVTYLIDNVVMRDENEGGLKADQGFLKQ